MTTTRFGLRSLPTYYKGITFRSRLEARWAIILDEMKIAWEYEYEGIEITASHFGDPHNPLSFPYLPDFYLPEYDSFVEVKGRLDEAEYWRLMRIAWCITGSLGSWGPKANGVYGQPFFVVGNIGQQGQVPLPISLYNYKGEIQGVISNHHFNSPFKGLDGYTFGSDNGEMPEDLHLYRHLLCNNFAERGNLGISALEKAVDIARKVRFEGGRHV